MPDGTPSAADQLLRLADTITAIPGDAKDPADYPYSTIRRQLWTTSDNRLLSGDVASWRAAEGSGRIEHRTLAPRRDPARVPDTAERQRLATAPAEVRTYPRADGTIMAGVVTEPVPDDPAKLAIALYTYRRTNCYPQALVRDFAMFAGVHYLDRAARAGALRMLATIPGLTYDGIARDLTGRTGWSFAVTAGTDRDTILLDTRTGVLLASSITVIVGAAPRFSSHALYLATDRTSTPDQAPDRDGRPQSG